MKFVPNLLLATALVSGALSAGELENDLAKAQKERKPVLYVILSKSCGACEGWTERLRSEPEIVDRIDKCAETMFVYSDHAVHTDRYPVNGFPTGYILDPDGKIIFRFSGVPKSDREFADYLCKIRDAISGAAGRQRKGGKK